MQGFTPEPETIITSFILQKTPSLARRTISPETQRWTAWQDQMESPRCGESGRQSTTQPREGWERDLVSCL